MMEEHQGNRNFMANLPGWMKNPFVLVGAGIIIIVILYLLLPYFKTLQSPFTQYKPLPIDSTYIKLDTSSEKLTDDGLSIQIDSIPPAKEESAEEIVDTSSIADLFKLNTDYHKLDPNEQLNRAPEDDADDLFSQLVLSDLDPSSIQQIQEFELSFDIPVILEMLSVTGVEMLSGIPTNYHMDILEAIEKSSGIHGILLADKGEKVQYATNRKFRNQYLFELFPRMSFNNDQLRIQKVDSLQFISMPIHHQYGKVGYIILVLKG